MANPLRRFFNNAFGKLGYISASSSNPVNINIVDAPKATTSKFGSMVKQVVLAFKTYVQSRNVTLESAPSAFSVNHNHSSKSFQHSDHDIYEGIPQYIRLSE